MLGHLAFAHGCIERKRILISRGSIFCYLIMTWHISQWSIFWKHIHRVNFPKVRLMHLLNGNKKISEPRKWICFCSRSISCSPSCPIALQPTHNLKFLWHSRHQLLSAFAMIYCEIIEFSEGTFANWQDIRLQMAELRLFWATHLSPSHALLRPV